VHDQLTAGDARRAVERAVGDADAVVGRAVVERPLVRRRRHCRARAGIGRRLAGRAREARRAGAGEAVDSVGAGAAVLARIGRAVVDVDLAGVALVARRARARAVDAAGDGLTTAGDLRVQRRAGREATEALAVEIRGHGDEVVGVGDVAADAAAVADLED